MKGVKKGNEQKVLERTNWVKERFRRDCRERMARGFVDPALSPPKANKEFEKKFKTAMNSQRMYRLREEIFEEFGLDKYGIPKQGVSLPGVPELKPVAAAIPDLNRDPADPLFHVLNIGIPNESYGNFLQEALAQMAQRGLIPDTVKVDHVQKHYVAVSSWEEGQAQV